jgi:uncharacterized protein
VLIAYSGGVDSALVAKLAQEALGGAALAVIADTETLPRRELAAAKATAAEIGIELLVVRASELANPAYAANPANRCYFCREGLAGLLLPIARERAIPAIADGVHRSDLGDIRPGIRAMDEAGFWHPLLEAGLGKEDVRRLARDAGLSCWDKPSNACLSSRIAPGEAITEEALRRVEAAESFLQDMGFRQVRVRHRAGGARVEVGREELDRLFADDTRRRVAERLRELAFTEVVLDPDGYGSRRA